MAVAQLAEASSLLSITEITPTPVRFPHLEALEVRAHHTHTAFFLAQQVTERTERSALCSSPRWPSCWQNKGGNQRVERIEYGHRGRHQHGRSPAAHRAAGGEPRYPQTIVTPALVRRILPIRANPAVGVVFWATDLQGLAADVESFADYIRREAENRQAIADAADVASAYIDLLIGDETEV